MPANPPTGKTEQPPQATPAPRPRPLDREEPELAQEEDIPSDDRPSVRKDAPDARR